MKAGAQLVKREPVNATPLPPVEFHTATVHHIGATSSEPPLEREVVEQMPSRWELILWTFVLVIMVWASWLAPLWVKAS